MDKSTIEVVSLDLNNYLAARNLVTAIGQPLMFISLLLGVLLIAATALRSYRGYSRHILLAILLVLTAGFVLLIWFHFRIYQTLPLMNPANGQVAGRYAIPVWIEDEKLYFWTLLTILWLVLMKRRKGAFQHSLNMVAVVFLALTAFSSNPFPSPLNNFNNEIITYSQAAGGSISSQMQAFGGAFGRMQGFYNSTYMWIHPPLLFIAYSTFVISFIAILFMLVKKDRDYEHLAYAWAKAGYIVLTIGLLLGYPWAAEAWKGQPWWYSPKINVTLMMWVLYSAYIHSRLYIHRRGMWTTTGTLGILAFTAVIATYLSTYVLPGIHSLGG